MLPARRTANGLGLQERRATFPPPMSTTRRLPESTWAEIRTAYAAGIGLREMARKLGIPAGTVLARANREHWTGQIQQARTLATSEMQSDAISVSMMQSAALTMAERGQRHVERMADIAEKVAPHVEMMKPGEILERIEKVERFDKLARRTFGIEDGSRRGGVNLTFNMLSVDSVRPIETSASE